MMQTQEESAAADDAELRDNLALVVSRMKDSKMRRRYQSLIELYDAILKDEDTEDFRIGVYGCPKKGKSTLLNSLLGAEILPNAPIPSTSSVINLYRREKEELYEINCYAQEGSDKNTVHRGGPEEVRGYLETNGSHQGDSPKWDKIEVLGPFPNASLKLKSNFVLQDTPGAEAFAAALGEEASSGREEHMDPKLKEDSKRAIASIDQAKLHLFCVACNNIGNESDRKFYEEYFSERACVHVLTHKDRDPRDKVEIIDEYKNRMGLVDNEEAVMRIVLTGIKDYATSSSKMINIGKEDLIGAILESVDPKALIGKMRQIAKFVCGNCDRMDVLKTIPKIYIDNLKEVLERPAKEEEK